MADFNLISLESQFFSTSTYILTMDFAFKTNFLLFPNLSLVLSVYQF